MEIPFLSLGMEATNVNTQIITITRIEENTNLMIESIQRLKEIITNHTSLNHQTQYCLLQIQSRLVKQTLNCLRVTLWMKS